MPAGADIQQVIDEFGIVVFVIGEVNSGGVDDQQWRIIIKMKKLAVRFVQLLEILALEELFESDAALAYSFRRSR